MAWKALKSTQYKGASGSDGSLYIKLNYEDTSDTVKTLKLKFTGTGKYDTTYQANGYYVLWAPGTANEKLFKVKAPGAKWSASGSAEFTVTKTYTSEGFSIPEYWICNTGGVVPDLTARTIKYDDYKDSKGNAKSFYGCFQGDGWTSAHPRANYKTVQSKWTEKTAAKKATAVGAGSVSITDNFNNSYTVKGTGGSAGTNNAVKSATLTYSNADGTNVTADCKGKTTTKKVAFTPSGADGTKTIKASVQTVGTYNTPDAATASLDVKQYVGPNRVSTLKISYNKSRFTLKEDWKFSWDTAVKNNECPVKGYRIRLYRKRNGVLTKLPLFREDGWYLSTTDTRDGDVYYDSENTLTELTIYPKHYIHTNDSSNIKPGDEISFSVRAYSKYGENYDGSAMDADGSKLLFNGKESFYCGGVGATHLPSLQKYLKVQNAGVVRVKTASGWVEGQVHVRVSGKWVEAETVKVRSGSSWKEAE